MRINTIRTGLPAALAFGFASSLGFGYDVNKDLKNLGPNAQDLGVLLSGSETVTSHFDGYSSGANRGQFGSFASGPNGPNTEMRWRNFSDGTDNTINTNQTIHVGWSTADHSSNTLDMYWTDAQGNAIPGSKVYNITSGWTYERTALTYNVSWENIFSPAGQTGDTVLVSNVRYVALRDALPLDMLNAENTQLMASLQPLPGGSALEIPYGQSMSLLVPGPIPEDDALVLVYGVTGPGSMAEVTDFVQVPEPASLTLFAAAGLAMIRRRPQY